MTYDNRVNRLHAYLRDAFRNTPFTAWTTVVLALGYIVLLVLFPLYTLAVTAVVAAFCGIMYVFGRIIDEL